MKQQLHVSGMNLLSRCGIAFENRYIKEIKTPRSVSLALGTAVDRAVTCDLTSKKDSGELLPDSDVLDIARDAAVSEMETGDVAVDGQDEDEGWTASKGAIVDAAVDMAGFHHREAAPDINPTHVQRAWVLDIAGLDMQLAGTIDVQEGSRSIRDTKTSGKSPAKDTADKSLQLTMYSLAVRQLDGKIPDKVALDYVVRTPKRKDVKLVQLESKRVDADLNHLIARVQAAEAVIKSGVFSPADPTAWWCSQRFCSYWNACPYAARPVSVRVAA